MSYGSLSDSSIDACISKIEFKKIKKWTTV